MQTLIPRFLIAFLAAVSSASFAQQVCRPGQTLVAPNSRYVVQADTSQVLDTKTKLVWQRCSVGQIWNGSSCTGNSTGLTWLKAKGAAASAGGSGGFVWRMPNISELTDLIESACYNPAINTSIFPTTNPVTGLGAYWSSTSPEDNWGSAVYFDSGSIAKLAITGSQGARLVRASQ